VKEGERMVETAVAKSNDKTRHDKRITTYVTPEDYKKISLIALQKNISMSSALHYCIEQFDISRTLKGGNSFE